MTVKPSPANQAPDRPERETLDLVAANQQALREVVRHLENGRAEKARIHCREIIAHTPGDPIAIHLLGMIEFHSGNLTEAGKLVAEAVAIEPNSIKFLADFAAVLRTLERLPEAIDVCRKILALDGKHGDTWYRLGCFLKDAGDLSGCIDAFREAVELRPGFVPGLLNLGVSLKENGDFAAAEVAYRRALEIDPRSVSANYNLGNLLQEIGEYEQAEIALNNALQLDPDNTNAQYNLGLVVDGQNRGEEAAEIFNAILERTPRHANARNSLGLTLQERGNLDAAIACFDSAIAIDPTHGDARYNRSLVRLLQGQLGDGWDEYDYRWETSKEALPQFDAPFWKGENLSHKHITVFGEQGPGDVVMFAQCLPDLLAAADTVSIKMKPRLVELLRRSFPACSVAPYDAADGSEIHVEADYVVQIGSLPRFFRRSEEDFRAVTMPYLTPDPQKVERWRQRYAEFGEGPVIGVSWRGGATTKEKKRRVMELGDWVPLLSRSGATFVSLQYGDRASELASFHSTRGITIHDWEDAVVDLDDFAAQIEALDLVISVANTTVHFAGALNKDVWTLTPAQPSWRWQLEREDSPWYPSMRIMRQGWDEPWSAVLGRAAADLDDVLGSGVCVFKR